MITPMRAFNVLVIDIFMSIVALDGCSTDDVCFHFRGLAYWNQEYVTSLCVNDGLTDKSTSAVLCDAYVGNTVYEESLKLAILNTMYGTGPSTFQCQQWCMYDPLSVTGEAAVGFRWKNNLGCWNVVVGATNRLCYTQAQGEWEWAISKTENWCCPSDHIPTIMPTPAPTLSPLPCAADENCYQKQDYSSWNQEYVMSLCNNHGDTDKSVNATLCDPYVDDVAYEYSLNLAIVNAMYGTGATASYCPWYCMYDPLHVGGPGAIGFKWMNRKGCWKVLFGATNYLCYVAALQEWESAVAKTYNWCCPSY